jgi:PAS domain S-box-containing protein
MLNDPLINGILINYYDISIRKESEKQLKESQERFDKLSEHSRVMNWETNADGLLTYVSRVCRILLGYEPEEIIGKLHFYDLHPAEGREEF